MPSAESPLQGLGRAALATALLVPALSWWLRRKSLRRFMLEVDAAQQRAWELWLLGDKRYVPPELQSRFAEWFLEKHCPEAEVPLEPTIEERPRAGSEGGCSGSLRHIHVAYGSDRDAFEGLLGSMLSLSRHLRRPRRCTIHIFVPEADLLLAEQVLTCFRRELEGELVDIPTTELRKAPDVGFNFSDLPLLPFWVSPLTFSRFYLHAELPASVPRVLWLDTDTVIQADIGPLYRMAMRHPVAAALDLNYHWSDFYVNEFPALREHFPDEGGSTFNAGVLLLDLRSWRSGDITRSLEAWVQRLEGRWGDQLPLNVEFRGRFDVLDWRWNRIGVCLYTDARLPERCLEDAKILHLNGVRPWQLLRCDGYHPCGKSADLYQDLYGLCSWRQPDKSSGV